jgi:hypothetical protein
MPTHLQKAKMTQQKVKLTKKDKKEVRRDNLKKEVTQKAKPSSKHRRGEKKPQKKKPKKRY